MTDCSDRACVEHTAHHSPAIQKAQLVIDQCEHAGSFGLLDHLASLFGVQCHGFFAKDGFSLIERSDDHCAGQDSVALRSSQPSGPSGVVPNGGTSIGSLAAAEIISHIGARPETPLAKLAAAQAIADVVDGDRLNASFIVPSVFDNTVAPAVAEAVRMAAIS